MAHSDPSMTDPDTWFDAYERLRVPGPEHPSEWLGTPLAITGLVAWLWSLPTPAVFRDAGPALNWGTVFLMATVVYYFILSIRLAFGSLPFVVLVAAVSAWLERRGLPLGQIGSTAFVAALAWQLLASQGGTRGPAVASRLQHLMIGPLWLLAAVYRRVGISY